jgi:Putative prokaryotic signal transducing protein
MDKLVVVEVAGTEPEAELLCGLLRSAGIGCTHRQTNYAAGASDGMPVGGPQEVIVRAEDLESARAVLGKR